MQNKTDIQAFSGYAASAQRVWPPIAVLATVFVLTYYGTLSLFLRTWAYSADAYHGFLIPFISLYFVWADRERLKKIPIKSNIIGGALLTLAGTFVLLLGNAGSVKVIEMFSIIVIIPGIVLLVFGTRLLKALALPLSYLVLMVPFLDAVDELHRPFQYFSATMGAFLLKLIHIPVLQNGLYLELPNVVLEVAVACSGLNFLFSIIAVAVPLAMFALTRIWQRVFLISAAVLIGVVANWFRVALVGVWTYLGGTAVHGPLHIFQGLFVSVIGFIFLFVCVWAIRKFSAVDGSAKKETDKGPSVSHVNSSKRFNLACGVAVALLLCIKGYTYFHIVEPVPLKAPLGNLPLVMGRWTSSQIDAYNPPFSIENADVSFARKYTSGSERDVGLYVGYFRSQSQGKKLIDYRSRLLHMENEKVALKNSVVINKSMFKDKSHKFIALFWYDLNGRIYAGRYDATIATALDGILSARTSGSIVIVFSEIKEKDREEETFDEMLDFVNTAFPALRNHLP